MEGKHETELGEAEPMGLSEAKPKQQEPWPSNDYTVTLNLDINVPGKERFDSCTIRFVDGEVAGVDVGYDAHPAIIMLARNVMSQARGNPTRRGQFRGGPYGNAAPVPFPYSGAVLVTEPQYGPSADY